MCTLVECGGLGIRKITIFNKVLLGKWWRFGVEENLMWETQKDFYLVLFMFASQLYFYVLGPSSLLDY